MRNILFAAAVFLLSHLPHSAYCVSRAEKETMYGEILARAQQRKLAFAATLPEQTGGSSNHGKFTAEHAKLIQDVTLTFGKSIAGSEKFEFFKRLITKLGMPETPVGMHRFREFSGWVNRQKTGKCPNRGNGSKLGPEASEKLHKMLSEKPTLTLKEASEELEKIGVVALPPPNFLLNWIQQRRQEIRFFQMLAEPLGESSAVTEDDDFSCSLSVFGDDQEEEIVDNGKRKAADATLPAKKKARSVDEEMYNNLLMKARRRRGHNNPLSDSNQSKIEQTELIADVVRTCEFLTVGEQYEVFRRLSEDLGIPETSNNIFYTRARSVRKRTGCSVVSRCVLDAETTKVIKSIFESNPKISTNEAHAALQKKEGHVPSLGDVRKWLTNHKSNLLRSKKRRALLHSGESNGSKSGSSTEEFPDDVDIGNLVSELLAEDHDTP